MWQVWCTISGICFVLEIITVGFLVFWFAIGALITAFVSLFTDNIMLQTTVFVLSSTALLFLTKPFVKKFSREDKVQTNAYSVIGKTGIVTSEINEQNKLGQVTIGSEVWTAKAAIPISEGSQVIIKQIDGVKVIVEPILTPVIK